LKPNHDDIIVIVLTEDKLEGITAELEHLSWKFMSCTADWVFKFHVFLLFQKYLSLLVQTFYGGCEEGVQKIRQHV
jgi:hypothetical protein